MKSGLVFPIISAVLIVSCSRDITEEMVKKEIKTWWGVEEIEDVVVESFAKSGKSMVFDSRLVLAGDTLERMTYEFRRGFGGWQFVRGPFGAEQKAFLLEQVGLSNIGFFQRQRELVEMFKGVMDMYGSYTQGKYPPLLSTSIDAIPGYQGDKGEETVLSMMRPFLEGELPFIDAKGDTAEWFEEYRRKVVYFPLQKEDDYVLQYSVKAGMDTCFAEDIISRWREISSGE